MLLCSATGSDISVLSVNITLTFLIPFLASLVQVIPIVDLAFYNGNKYQLFNPFLHYSWRGREKGVHRIVADHRSAKVQAIVPGLDAATNCNLALINVGMSGPEYDDGNLHRSLDPMAGGMTPYHTQASPVVRDLPAGGELFKFYGDRW